MSQSPSPVVAIATRSCPEEHQTRETIFFAAASLFARKGYAATSVREIVQAAGVTKPAMYYYFKNKEDLYTKLMEEALSTLWQIISAVTDQKGTMRQRLYALFLSVYELFRNHVDFVRLVNMSIHGPRDAAPPIDFDSAHRRLEGLIRQLVEPGVSEGELRGEDMDDALFLLLGLFRSIQTILVVQPPGAVVNAHIIARSIDVIFDGMKVSQKQREAP